MPNAAATIRRRTTQSRRPRWGGNGDADRYHEGTPRGHDSSPATIRYVAALKTPTFCIEGSRSQNGRNFGQLQAAAAGAPLHTFIIPHGTHFNILHSLTALLATKIAADAGPTCNITLGQKELDDAFNSFLDAQAKARQAPLVTVTPAAAARIAERAPPAGTRKSTCASI